MVKHEVYIYVVDEAATVKITMCYGQTINDVIGGLTNGYGREWYGTKLLNIHNKQLPDNMPLRGNMTVYALKKNEG